MIPNDLHTAHSGSTQLVIVNDYGSAVLSVCPKTESVTSCSPVGSRCNKLLPLKLIFVRVHDLGLGLSL